MIIDNLKNMKDGWLIGNFEPSILKTDSFEVCVKEVKNDEPHYHKKGKEYNIVLDGEVEINGTIFKKDDVFIIEAFEVVNVEVLGYCRVLVVRPYSNPKDKYIV